MSQDAFSLLDITASALEAQRVRFGVTTKNIVNARTLSTDEGGPYRRQVVVFEAILDRAKNGPDGAVRASVESDPSPFQMVHDPGHPEAVDGLVAYPNVNPFQEMVDLVDAGRMYEANIAVLRSYRDMVRQTLEITRG